MCLLGAAAILSLYRSIYGEAITGNVEYFFCFFCVFDAAFFPLFFGVPKFATHSLNYVISALPMNGGSYNVLINTTSKAIASIAACLGVISYIATGVVSATTVSSII